MVLALLYPQKNRKADPNAIQKYYDAYAMRAEVFFSNQEDSGCWFFSETNWFQVGVGGFAYKMCGFGGLQDCSFFLVYGIDFVLLWRLRDRNWTVLVVSFSIIMGWFRSQRKENSWIVEIGYHYTHRHSALRANKE